MTFLSRQGVLIGCAPSSGSTLLSVILNAHEDIVCGPEISLLSHPFFWRDSGYVWQNNILRSIDEGGRRHDLEWNLAEGFVPYIDIMDAANIPWYGYSIDEFKSLVKHHSDGASFVNSFFYASLAKKNAQVWIEKSPPNLFSIDAFLSGVPSGKAIIVYRDGRDVVCSLMKRGMGFLEATAVWLKENSIAANLFRHEKVKFVRYEEMVTDPVETINEVLAFLGVDKHAEKMLSEYSQSSRVMEDDSIKVPSWKQNPSEPISTKSVGRWKNELSDEQLKLFWSATLSDEKNGKTSIREVMSQFGYDESSSADYGQRNIDSIKWVLDHELYLSPDQSPDSRFHQKYVSFSVVDEFRGRLRAFGALSEFDSREAFWRKEYSGLKDTCQQSEGKLRTLGDKLDACEVTLADNDKKLAHMIRRIGRIVGIRAAAWIVRKLYHE